MATSSAPIDIKSVTLTVHDLPRVAAFYEGTVGLARIAGSGEELHLGAEGQTLLTLRQDRAARRSSPREAGLFHTAFLLPDRAALGSWMKFAIQKQFEVQGASDHLVSEAFYLADPEGNGVEIYADRPRESWGHRNGEVVMSTDPLDLHALSAVAGAAWRGAPSGSVVGHVHLQTGQLSAVEEFYTKTLGCTISTRYPGALFLGWGGYHHHLATNIWNSRGAGPRQEPATGLSEVILNADPEALTALGAQDGTRLADPFALAFRLEERTPAHAG